MSTTGAKSKKQNKQNKLGYVSEDDAVAWAKFDSMKIDKQRRDIQRREEEDLQLAIKLSLDGGRQKDPF
jgi:hypothetical protein